MNITDKIGGYFEYKVLPEICNEVTVDKRISSLEDSFNKISWNSEENQNWMLREYLAVKMIISSSILLSSAEFSGQRNLRVVEPYLLYYSLLNCSRAIIFTSPLQEWNNGRLINLSHKKTISIAADIIKRFNREVGEKFEKQINLSREYREVYSYRFPANGLTGETPDLSDTISTCRMICEIAQFQSQILENVSPNLLEKYEGFDWNSLELGYKYGEKELEIVDSEDMYRLSYMERKFQKPFNLELLMTEGLVEDAFGAWYPEDDEDIDNLYNPDDNWQIIFPMT